MDNLQYEDFNVRLARLRTIDGKSRFNVWVEGRTPAGWMSPENEAELDWDPTAFWDDPSTAYGGLAGMPEQLRVEKRYLRQLGEQLADLALPEGHVRRLFGESLKLVESANKGLRLRLHIDSLPLARLPWEYLLLPDDPGDPVATDFLALRKNVSIVRTPTVEWMGPELPPRDHYRVIGVLSSPDGPDELDLAKDRSVLENAAKVLNAAGDGIELLTTDWVEEPATRAGLRAKLTDLGGADVLHFGGHGLYDVGTREGVLLFESEDGRTPDPYGADELAVLLRSSGVRLVFLGACESSRGSGKNAWSGIAQALTRQRIPAVVGNQFELRDDLAAVLHMEVYSHLFRGMSIDQALSNARIAMMTEKGLEARDWGVPTLYLRNETGVLFPAVEDGGDDNNALALAKIAKQLDLLEQGGVTGVDVGHMQAGTVEVEQVIGNTKKAVTGVRADRMNGGKIIVKQEITDD